MYTPITPRAKTLVTAALLAASISAPLSAQSQWTDLGCDLPGTAGSPVLSGTGPLTPLSSNSVELDNAADNALAMFFLALTENPVNFKGGVLKPVPFIDFPLLTTTNTGEIDLPFVWPNDLPDGFPFYMQYAVQDAGAVKGVALSNALRGLTPGTILVDEISTSSMDVGDVFSISGGNFGNDPDDLCVLLVDEQGQTVGFTRAQSASGNSMTTQVGAIRPGATTANLMLNTGNGGIVPPQTSPPGVTFLNGGSWVIESDPSTAVMVDQELELFPEPNQDAFQRGQDYQGGTNFYQYLYSELSTNGWLEIVMPQGDCPPDTTFWFQLDACSTGGVVSLDYGVELQNTTAMSALDCATIICQEFQLAVLAELGILLTCIPVQQGSDVILRILPPPTEDWKDYSGAYFSICFPAVACDYYYDYYDAAADVFELTMPLTTPNNAAASVYAEGFTDQSNYGWSWDSVVMPSGPSTPLGVATAIAAAIQDQFDDQGFFGQVAAVTSGPDVLIEFTPPTSENWDYGWIEIQICELQ
jgi:hypothetical protein